VGIHTKTLIIEGDPLLIKWEDLKTLIKCNFYFITYLEE